jgi:DDE superfamily endonuclease
MPTLRTTWGLNGHRPLVGHLDCHEVVYLFGALNLVTGPLTTRMAERHRPPAPGQRATSKQRFWQAAVARHRRDSARAYPAAHAPRVVLVIDTAPWPRGAAITAVLTARPPLELYRLPSDSPPLQVSERWWKVVRRRATHNRLFPTNTHLQPALRNSLCDDQTLKHRVRSLIHSPKKRTELSAA